MKINKIGYYRDFGEECKNMWTERSDVNYNSGKLFWTKKGLKQNFLKTWSIPEIFSWNYGTVTKRKKERKK